jgi:hypothetical protein
MNKEAGFQPSSPGNYQVGMGRKIKKFPGRMDHRACSWSNRTTGILNGVPQGLAGTSGKLAQKFSVEIEMTPKPAGHREICMAVWDIFQDLTGDKLPESYLPFLRA